MMGANKALCNSDSGAFSVITAQNAAVWYYMLISKTCVYLYVFFLLEYL